MATTKDLSYSIRRQIVGEGDYSIHRPGARPVTLENVETGERVRLLSTTNAGFRGIEAFVERADGTRRHECLGEFKVVR